MKNSKKGKNLNDVENVRKINSWKQTNALKGFDLF